MPLSRKLHRSFLASFAFAKYDVVRIDKWVKVLRGIDNNILD